ncbi:MAG: hypothetical protein QXI12_00400 [Candidatus Methanomethyliaceae archaeon]
MRDGDYEDPSRFQDSPGFLEGFDRRGEMLEDMVRSQDRDRIRLDRPGGLFEVNPLIPAERLKPRGSVLAPEVDHLPLRSLFEPPSPVGHLARRSPELSPSPQNQIEDRDPDLTGSLVRPLWVREQVELQALLQGIQELPHEKIDRLPPPLGHRALLIPDEDIDVSGVLF